MEDELEGSLWDNLGYYCNSSGEQYVRDSNVKKVTICHRCREKKL